MKRRLVEVLANYEPGSQDWSWRSEFRWLEENHRTQLQELMWSMRQFGQKTPIDLGPDCRIWDGHHRLWAAVQLGWDEVDVNYM